MASREQLIFDLLTGKNELTPALAKTEKQTKKVSAGLSKGLTKAFKGVGIAAGATALAVVGVGIALKKALTPAVEESVRLENALLGLGSVAINTGNDLSFITKEAKELSSDGLIPLADVSESLKNLLATGLSGEEAVKTFKNLRQAAAFNRQGQLSLGEAIRGASEGLKNDLSIKVDNAGITKNLSILNKEYAESIGKTVGNLTKAEKVQAKVVGIAKEAALFQGDYNSLLQTFQGAQSKSTGEWRFLLAEIGDFITKSPIVVAFIQDQAKTFKRLKNFLIDNRDAIQQFVNKGLKFFIGLTPLAIEAAQVLTKAVGVLGRIALVAAQGWIELGSLLADTEIFKAAADGIVGLIRIVVDSFSSLTQLLLGTDFGQGLAEKLGIDPLALNTKLTEIKDGIKTFSEDFTGGEVAEGLNAARKSVENALILNDEQIEKVGSGLERVKTLVKESTDAIISADEKRTRLASANEVNRTKTKKKNLDKQKADEKAFYDFSLKQEQLNGRQRVAALKGTLSTISTLTSSSNKELFAIGKASAISVAILDGISATQKALTAAPPPFNFALAALVGAASAINIAKIGASKPPAAQGGGILDPNGSGTTGDFLSFRGNSGEAILTKGQQLNFLELANGRGGEGNSAGLEELFNGLRESLLAQPVVVQVDQREIARAVRDEVQGGFAIV